MGTYVLSELVNDPLARIETVGLGASNAAPLTDLDIGKALKLVVGADSSAYEITATGDEIEGFLASVNPNTVNNGFGVGGVQRDRRVLATVSSDQVGAIAIGGLVVAGVQTAANTAGGGAVKGGAPTTHIWRVLRHVTGTGVAGDTVLIEKV